jgi:K+-transporting ATPase ATPase C chain
MNASPTDRPTGPGARRSAPADLDAGRGAPAARAAAAERFVLRNQWKPALLMLGALTVLTGLVYPLAFTGFAQLVFPRQADGSLLDEDGRVVGSRLIGQPFTSPGFFWSRPSATGPQPYNAAVSSGSNLGPSNEDLRAAVEERVRALQSADAGGGGPVPVDVVTASGSGLDPHISPAAALYQVPRVARARGVPEEVLRDLVRAHTQGRQLGFLGEPAVNVLELNLALERGIASSGDTALPARGGPD